MSIVYDLGYGRNKDFVICEDEFHEDSLKKHRDLMGLGNGYLSLGDYFEEDYEKQTRKCFIKKDNDLILVPDVINMAIFIDDEEFNLDTFEIIDYEKTLNMRNGISQRTMIVRKNKKDYKIIFEKFISMENPNLIGQRVVISGKKDNCNVKIFTGINGNEFADKKIKSINDEYLFFSYKDKNDEYIVNSKIIVDAQSEQSIEIEEDNKIFFKVERDVRKGKTFVLEKISTIRASFDERVYDEKIEDEEREKNEKLTFHEYSLDEFGKIKEDIDTLMQQSETAWNQKVWSNFDIKIDFTGEVDQFGTRFSIYHENKNITNHLDNFVEILNSKDSKKVKYDDFLELINKIINDGENLKGEIWKIVITQFAGVTIENNTLNLSPDLPIDWSTVEFNLPYNNLILKFEITNNVLKINYKEDEEFDAIVFGRKRKITKNTIIPYLI